MFLAVTFTGVSAVGIWWALTGDITDEADQLRYGGLAMFTPTLGMLAAAAASGTLRRPKELLASTGMLVSGRWSTILRYCAIGVLLPLVILAATLGISVLLGEYHLRQPLPWGELTMTVAMSVLTFVPALVLVLGEELGWGYLLPRLLPLGLWPGLLLAGLLWGLFHAPLTLQGYGYPDQNGLVATLMFTVAHVLLGTLMGWIRLASGSVWPAVALHGASNMLANPIPAVIGQTADPARLGQYAAVPTAWPSWFVLAALIGILACRGHYRRPFDHIRHGADQPQRFE
nr:CPBP family glutamic-type intramembrane protease [Kibdelosporangium sp. MJ126-NF4]ADB02868.1 AzicU7 [Kibdelosporangium sp. MJ126-NF4]CEL14081.1 CAAX amino terminal protease family protein [Kibdelosporangium sp. MJ126-NF4]CTQ88447.1 CAAX amino terminal protease family protein [Kibdelosporangium sp. MJ126-NF4]